MPDKEAILLFEQLYRRTDKQIRDLLAAQRFEAFETPEIDTINVVIGDGATVLVPGIAAALRVDFRATIVAAVVLEFDGTAGSVSIDIEKSPATDAIVFSSIVASLPPGISASRYGELTDLTGWTTRIDRGDTLRFSVISATDIMRVLVALRIRRLEP